MKKLRSVQLPFNDILRQTSAPSEAIAICLSLGLGLGLGQAAIQIPICFVLFIIGLIDAVLGDNMCI